MRETYEVTRKLLSNETTNCLLPVCTKIKGQVGKICPNKILFHIFLNTLGEPYNSTNASLILMITENGCGFTDENEQKQYCSYLLLMQEDANITESIKLRANNTFTEVSL